MTIKLNINNILYMRLERDELVIVMNDDNFTEIHTGMYDVGKPTGWWDDKEVEFEARDGSGDTWMYKWSELGIDPILE